MTYATLMSHLEVGLPNAGVLDVTASLAHRMGTKVIGIAARQPVPIVRGEGYAFGELLQKDMDETQARIDIAQAEFEAALQARSRDLEWRSTMVFESLSTYLRQEARSADLVITGMGPGELFDPAVRVNMGDLVMQVGRPVLVVPPKAKRMALESVWVGWSDTREARRAAFDALPLLKMARLVVVFEIVDKENMPLARARLADVVAWLACHGIRAQARATPLPDDDAVRLHAVAKCHGADLIVAGAYGHNRLREWVFGGATQDLLHEAECCLLMSH